MQKCSKMNHYLMQHNSEYLHACSPPASSVHGILQARILEWVAMPSSRDLPDPRIEPVSPELQADSLPLSHWGTHNSIYIPFKASSSCVVFL